MRSDWAAGAAWILILALILPSLAQAPAGSSQEPPVLRVTARLVQVNVIVQDKKGQPVRDLTRDDFVVLDEGKSHPISFFSVESNERAPEAEAAPPDIFSNHLERRGGVPTSATVVLMDALNTRFTDQAYAKKQLIRFLQQQLQPHDRIAILSLTTRLRVVHDFTRDTASLLRALERYLGRHTAELDASEPEEPDTGDEQLDEFLREVNQAAADYYVTRRVETTLAALEAIANHLASLPGRKNLIWVSGGFPFSMNLESTSARADKRTFSEEIRRAVRAVNTANVAIYPVDARGLIGVFDMYPEFSPASNMRPRPGAPLSGAAASRIRATHDTMYDLADRTGGRAFINSNDIQGSIRQALEDSRVTYTLGYYPRHGQWDGRFRQIKVRVKHPGAEVRYRRGYYAFADQPLDEKQKKEALAAAVWAPLEATGLRMTVRLLDPPAAGRPLKFAIQVPPRQVTLEQKDGRWTGSVEALFVQKSAEGKNLGGKSDIVHIRMGPENYQAVQQHGMVFNAELEIVPAAVELRVALRDNGSGAIGSVIIPFKGVTR